MKGKRLTQTPVLFLIFLFVLSIGGVSKVFSGQWHDGREIPLNSAVPDASSSDLIIKAGIKKGNDWKNKEYPFIFKVEGEKYIKKAKGIVKKNIEKAETARSIQFSTQIRFRLPPGKHTLLFDSPEKFRPMVVRVNLVAGKTHHLEFKPVYYSNKGSKKGFKDSLSEYEAWQDGEKISMRYEGFNIH